MKCVTCKVGDTHPGKTVITIAEGGSTIVVKDVPAEICDVCGAYYLDADVLEEVRLVVKHEKEIGAEITVVKLNKAA
jgi:YgiT-type zinc finger domain-containing protein